MSRRYRELPRCLHGKFTLNPSCNSPRSCIKLSLPPNRNTPAAPTSLRNDVQNRFYSHTGHVTLRKRSLLGISQPTITKCRQYCTSYESGHTTAYETLQNEESGNTDVGHRFRTLLRYRSESVTEPSATSLPGLPRVDRKERSKTTFRNMLQLRKSPGRVFPRIWLSNERRLSTLAAPELLDTSQQPTTRTEQPINPGNAFRSPQSESNPDERPHLPLSTSFEIFFKRLLRLQNLYGKTMRGGKFHFAKFARFLSSPAMKGLNGSQFGDWICKQPEFHISHILFKALLGSMVSSARNTLDILAHVGPFRENFSNRMRCLRYIFWAHMDELDTNEDLMKEFDRQLAQLVESSDWPGNGMRRTQIRLILRRLDIQNGEAFILRYLSYYVNPSSEALAEFARYYLQSGKPDLAFRMFSHMPDQSLQEPSVAVREVCVQMLRHDAVVQSATGPDFQYLPTLLEKGFQPDRYSHPLIIENALNGGYPSVAWDLYRYLSSTGNEMIARTFLVLLRHSFLNKDTQGVNEMMSIIHSREELYTNRFILAYAMNVVRVISYFDHGCSADEALSHILALYDRAYNRSTLIKLGIVAQESNKDSASKLWDPSPSMLGFTIWSYVLCHRHPSHVHRLWSWIRYLADQGDEKILRALEHDIIYNGLVLFYGRQRTTLLNALQVVQYMLEKKYCLPNSRTWSLLVCGYLKHDQLAQAHKIVDMMTQNGFTLMDLSEPDMPARYTIQDLASRKDEILDEKSMPSGLEVDQGDSSFSQLQSNATSSSRAKWEGMVDLRSVTEKG